MSSSQPKELPHQRVQELMADRGTFYGDGELLYWGYRNYAKALQAMVEEHTGRPLHKDLTPDFAVQVFTLVKLMRSIKPTPMNRDNYDDQSAYSDIAYLVRVETERRKKEGIPL